MKTRLFLLVITLVLLVGVGPATAQGGQICRFYPTCYSGGCGAVMQNPYASPWLTIYIYCWNGSSWDLQQFRAGCCGSV